MLLNPRKFEILSYKVYTPTHIMDDYQISGKVISLVLS